MNFVYIHKDDLRKWQFEALKIQQDIQNLLDKSEVDNWCGGGVLIGAARQGGFLYWDNDIDVFVKHKDLKKIFQNIWIEKLLEKYEIWSQTNGYWQRNRQLNKLLMSPKLDEYFLDFELK